MGLSHELISQFAKIVNSDKKQNVESTIYGTVVDQHGRKPGDVDDNGNEVIIDESGGKYIKPDGSDQLIPITDAEEDPAKANTTSNTDYGDRASVLIKNHTATVTGNISSPSANNKDVETKINEFDIAVGEQIQANKAYFKDLTADKANLGSLVAAIISVAELIAKDAEIENLVAKKATITDLVATKIDADIVEADYAKIKDLEATTAKVGSLDAEIADINTLMFGSATGNVLQTTFANAVIALLGDAQIKSAMIESLNASKINAGSIDTSKVKMESEDGRLVIFDNTIQISDGNRVRVQIGKDASDDYSINLWDAEGNLMLSEGGITDSAIKEAIIRNDMISDDANINAKKLDISSLFTEINDSTETIKSTKVYFDSQEQTLDVVFNEMNTTVAEQGDTIKSQGTDLSVIQGQINSKIWQQDIDTATEEMGTKYSELEQNLDGFKTTVSETYSTKADLDNLEIGGRNLFRHTSEMPIVDNYTNTNGIGLFTNGIGTLEDTGEGIKLTYDSNGKGSIAIPLAYDGAVDNGEIVTISFKYKGNMTNTCYHYFLQRESPNVTINSFPALEASDTDWLEYKHTFSHAEANARICYSFLLAYNPGDDWAGTWVEIKKGSLKLERGTNATDWTPAPEDMAGADDLKTAVDSLNDSIRSNVSVLETNANSITASVTSLEERTNTKIGDLEDDIDTIRKEVALKVSDENVQISIQKAISDGVTKVDTGTGFVFDETGMTVDKKDTDGNSISETSTNINENGMVVRDNNSTNKPAVLTANKDGVEAKDLEATTYLVIGGRSRFENYGDNRTACFWIGE